MPKTRFVFVLPAKNEQDTILPVLRALSDTAAGQGWDFSFVVVDDSSDFTAERARSFGAQVVEGGWVGLGQAMMRGLSAAMAHDPDWVFTMDSDGQADAAEIPLFYEAAKRKNADMVISSRFLSPSSIDYRYPAINWIGNRLLVVFLRLATGFRFTDSHGGIRLMRAVCIPELRLIGRHTYVQETLVQIHRRGFKIVEIPSRWKARPSGGSRVLRSITLYVVRTLPALLYWMRFHYLAILLSAAMLLGPFFQGEFALIYWGSALALGGASLFLWGISAKALRITDGRR